MLTVMPEGKCEYQSQINLQDQKTTRKGPRFIMTVKGEKEKRHAEP
jgi:hypothetical protein